MFSLTMNSYRVSVESVNWARPWIVWALAIALLLHIALGVLFYFLPLKKFGDPYFERLVPRAFRVERVFIDARLLDEAESVRAEPEVLEVTRVALEPEKPAADLDRDIRVTPAAPESPEIQLTDKPAMDLSSMDTALLEAQSSATLTDSEIAELSAELLRDLPDTSGRPLIEIPRISGGADGRLDGTGFSDLDALLESAGPVDDGQPILMDSELLFAYDSADLGDAASPSLAKLATLILRTPDARVLIEGHADSIGPFSYNMDLSERRAVAVKEWLVQNYDIQTEQILTVGHGNTRLLAPATGNIDEEAINRRVEILIQRDN